MDILKSLVYKIMWLYVHHESTSCGFPNDTPVLVAQVMRKEKHHKSARRQHEHLSKDAYGAGKLAEPQRLLCSELSAVAAIKAMTTHARTLIHCKRWGVS